MELSVTDPGKLSLLLLGSGEPCCVAQFNYFHTAGVLVAP